jgi:sortase A
MKPDENDDRRMGTPLIPQRSYIHTTPSTVRAANTQSAAANIVRSQIDSIYNTDAQRTAASPARETVATTTQPQQAELVDTNPYDRTQVNPAEVQAEEWKKYHSAWQDYYRQYYERYYVGEVNRVQQELAARTASASHQQTTTVGSANEPHEFSRDEAMYDLRSKLRAKVAESAKKVRKSRHFVPIAAACSVMVLFLFLQYNRVLFANVEAYISPGNIDPANIIVDPLTTTAVSSDPKLIIPKINVDVPVIYDVTPDYDAQMKAMEQGVAYFGIPGANSKPGQIGNTVLSGHSSNDIIDPGSYKFIFAQLDRLSKGDAIYVNYNGVRYTYTVTKKEVVAPTEVSKLVYPTDKPVLTLITCTPLGTSLNRLLVTAEQVSPSPASAQAAPDTASAPAEQVSMPGNSPTFLQRLFGQ